MNKAKQNQMEIDDNHFDEESVKNEANPDSDNEDLEDLRLQELEAKERVKIILEKVRKLDVEKEVGEKEKNKETRLIIDKIELNNFKSYQGVKEIGPLYHRFNAVVGPNGSGKSNLMESLLFVFGKRAKKLRLKKLSELIHTSTEFPNLKSARVSVYFKEIKDRENDGFDVIPNSEFVLTREVSRNSSSKYYINRQEFTYDNLCKKLEEHGIDLKHNRFLILQGEVEQISLLAPKAKINSKEGGLLEFLEDIIGTSRYVNIITMLSKDTEAMVDVKQLKEKTVRISRNELNGMEDIKNVSINYFIEEKELSFLNYLVSLLNIYEIELEVNACKEGISLKESELEQKNREIEQIKIDNEEILSRLREVKAEEKRNEIEWKKCKDQLDEYELQDKEKRLEVENTDKLITKHQNSKKALLKTFDDLTEKLQRADKEKPELIKSLESIKREILTLEKEISEKEKFIYDKTQSLQRKKQEVEVQVAPYLNEIEKNSLEMTQSENTIAILKSGLSNHEAILANTEKVQKETLEETQNMKKQIGELSLNLDNLKKESIELKSNFDSCIQNVKSSEIEISKLISKINELNSENQNQQQKSQLFLSLEKAKKNGDLEGVIGRLGDLGSIDAQYDVAISTCCPQLENIVVQSAENAEKVISFVKKNNLGKVTCILINEMQRYSNEMHREFHAPRGTDRLFNKIKFENEDYAVCFYFALRNTLVASNLDLANQVAYGEVRHRVVTLSGELIEPSGAMSGGGKPRSGLMSSKTVHKEDNTNILKKLTEEYDKLKQFVEEKQKQKSNSETLLNKNTSNISSVQNSISILENKLFSFERRSADLAKQLQKIKEELNKHNTDKSNLANLAQKVCDLKVANSDLVEKCQPFNAKLTAINDEIEKIGGKEMAVKKKKCEDMRKSKYDMENTLAEFEHTLIDAPIKMKKTREDMIIKEKMIEDLKKRNAVISEEIAKIEVLAEELVSVQDQVIALKEKASEEFKKLSGQANKFKDSMRKINTEKVSIEAEITKLKSEIKALDKKIAQQSEKQHDIRRLYEKTINEFGFIDEIQKDISKINKERGESQGEPAPDELQRDSKSKKLDMEKSILAYLNDGIFTSQLSDSELAALLKSKSDITRMSMNRKLKLEKQKPNMEMLKVYRSKLLEVKNKEDDLKETSNQYYEVRNALEHAKKMRLQEFMEGFNIINIKLKEMYRLITNGGDAELELVDSVDPFNEGVSFSVRPNKKSWKQIINLSGGEKTLSSLSLIFALHYYKPSPLYVMDEIDAALDFKNVSIIAQYIKERTVNSQFIIISLRSHMFDQANRLVGIYKTHDVTKTICLNNDIKEENQVGA